MLILGIDTSCDDTSCAVVRDGRVLLSNVVSSQVDLHAKYGGVVPEIASRKHLEMMVPVTLEALERANVSLRDLGAVAVTNGPGLLGSLLVGLSFGKSLAFALGIPIAGVHHLDGHIMANFLGDETPSFPLLNLVVSGGHSDLVLMKGPGAYELLGQTRDDAAGEIFDKVARELGLPFPGGPYLDREAEEGDPEFLDFTHPKIDGGRFDFSFSGMKTRALQALNSSRLPDGSVPPTIVRNISASLRAAVVRDLLWNVPMLLRETKARGFAVCGGVAANSLLRAEASRVAREAGVPLYIPPRELCTDNGAMIAAAAWPYLQGGHADGPELNADASLELVSRALTNSL
jgi:N6-L-threonylcarbamoyladenine synthase